LLNLCNGISYNQRKKECFPRKASYFKLNHKETISRKDEINNKLDSNMRPVSSYNSNLNGMNRVIRRNQFPIQNLVNRKLSKLLNKNNDICKGIESTNDMKIISNRKIPQRNEYNSTQYLFSKQEKPCHGSTVNLKFQNQNYVLETPKNEKNHDLLLSCKSGNYENVKEIIKNKLNICNYDINCRNNEGYSPLHLSIIGSYKDIVKLILKSNAKIEQRTKDKKTAFHLVCIHGNLDIARLLLYFGADVQVKDIDKNTPSHYAALNGFII